MQDGQACANESVFVDLRESIVEERTWSVDQTPITNVEQQAKQVFNAMLS